MTIRALLLLLAVVLAGCQGKKKVIQTPEEAFAALTEAAGDGAAGAGRIYTLLSERTRWSAISVHQNRRKICALIESHYPQANRRREQRRCALAARTRTTKAWFAAHVRRHRLIAPLAGLSKIERRSGSGARIMLESGGQKLAFCQEEGAWTYCGLEDHFEQLKLKAARDLTTFRENAEAYKRGH